MLRGIISSVLLVLALTTAAAAHPVAQGSLDVTVREKSVQLTIRASMEQLLVASTLTSNSDRDLSLAEQWTAHSDYLLQRLELRVAGTRDGVSPTADQLVPRSGEFVLFEYSYPLPAVTQEAGSQEVGSQEVGPLAVTLTQNILNEFEYAPGNRWEATYAVSIRTPDGARSEGLLLTSRGPLEVTITEAQRKAPAAGRTSAPQVSTPWLTVIGEFLEHGVMHILTGYDHLLFVCALVLATRTLLDLLLIVSAFTFAHTLTLTLATFNIVRLPSNIVEPLIALSIVAVALQNVLFPKASRAKSRLAIAFFFGLFHGLGFAGGLLDAMSQMSATTIWVALAAFSIGVEVGHQIVVLPLFGALSFVRSRQPDEALAAKVSLAIQRIASAAISVAGCIYLYAAL